MSFENEEPLKNHIEDRVNELTQNIECNAKRAVLVLYKNSKGYTEAISLFDKPNDDIECVTFNNEKDVVSVLTEQLKIYKDRMDKRELYCPQGIYVLVASDDIIKWDEVVFHNIEDTVVSFFAQSQIDFLILTDSDNSSEKNRNDLRDKSLAQSRYYIWLADAVNYGDLSNLISIQVLVNNARFGNETFGTKLGKEMHTNILGLRLEESNAIRQDIANVFLNALKKQIGSRDKSEIENEINDYLFSGEYRRKIISQVPTLDWLPVLGYEKVVRLLDTEYMGKNIKEKFIRFFKHYSVESSHTVYEILDILYDGKGDLIKTESIRKTLKNTVIPKICRDVLSNNKTVINNKIFQRFSMHEIIYDLRNYFLGYKQRIMKDIDELDKEIETILDTKFSYIDTELESILAGLSDYFEAFKKQCQNYIKYTWWEILSDYIGECKADAEKNYGEFKTAESVFRMSLFDEGKDGEDGKMTSGSEVTFFDMKDLKRKVDHFSSNVSFNIEDFSSIMLAKDRRYWQDFNGDINEQPMIYMVVSSDFSQNENLYDMKANTNLDMNWDFIFEEYIPKNLSYQIRVYNWS